MCQKINFMTDNAYCNSIIQNYSLHYLLSILYILKNAVMTFKSNKSFFFNLIDILFIEKCFHFNYKWPLYFS